MDKKSLNNDIVTHIIKPLKHLIQACGRGDRQMVQMNAEHISRILTAFGHYREARWVEESADL